MGLTKEQRARMARDMQGNRKFDGDTDIAPQYLDFEKLADIQVIERPAVDGWPYTIYLTTAKNKMPNAPVHINLHGGGFAIGHMKNDTLWSAWLADQIGGVVVDVDYTTTEFAAHPVQLDQCRDAARFTRDNCVSWGCDPKRISMGGYSAGGTLTIASAMKALETREVDYALLIDGYGPADERYDDSVHDIPDYWKTSEHRNEAFAVLMADDDSSVMQLPELCPLTAPDETLRGLPPTLIISAERCPFRFQDEQLGQRFATLGVEVTMKRFPDAGHGFIPHFMPHWDEAGALIVKMIRNTSL